MTKDSTDGQGEWLVKFYSGLAPDDRGRSLQEIWRWSDGELESVHDYVQWLFPLEERSGFNPGAPTLDEATVREFCARPELRASVRISFKRMLAFYGFELLGDPPRVVPSGAFDERSRNWLRPANHNHLRITRILKSLRLLGLEEEAAVFFHCLAALHAKESRMPHPRITEETFNYWRLAMSSSELRGHHDKQT